MLLVELILDGIFIELTQIDGTSGLRVSNASKLTNFGATNSHRGFNGLTSHNGILYAI